MKCDLRTENEMIRPLGNFPFHSQAVGHFLRRLWTSTVDYGLTPLSAH